MIKVKRTHQLIDYKKRWIYVGNVCQKIHFVSAWSTGRLLGAGATCSEFESQYFLVLKFFSHDPAKKWIPF